MTNAEVFHQVTTRLGLGGRLAREKRAGTPAAELYAAISRQAEELITTARQFLPRLPQIHFDFVYNGAVNAFAFKETNQYFIGVTSGTFVLLQLILCRMLSDSRLLTHAGHPESESSDLPPLTGLIPDAQRMHDAGTLKIERPKTEPRWLYSCHLLSQAALFIIGHEIAHITRGHVDYLDSKTGTPFLPEIGWNQPDAADPIARQTLEGDVDQRSLFSRLESVRLTLESQGPATPPWLSAPPSFDQLLFDCAFSVNCLYRLFGDIRFAGANLSKASYPPLPLRRAMLMLVALGYAEMVWGHDRREVAAAAIKGAMMATELGFATITGETNSVAGLDDAFGAAGRAHMKVLADCWNGGLRDRLAPFSYEPIREPPAFVQAVPS